MEKKETSKEEIKSIMTPRFLIVTTVLGLLFGIVGLVNDMFVSIFRNILTLGMEFSGFIGGPLILLTLIFLINYGRQRLRLNIQQLTVFYSVVSVAVVAGCFRGLWNFTSQIMGYAIPECAAGRWYGQFIGWPWRPSEEVVRPIFSGGMAVPSEWFVPIVWWMVFLWFAYFVVHGLVLIFRERWIEEERVIVPYTGLYNNILTLSTGEEEVKGRAKFALIGVIVGFVVFIPWLLQGINPMFPDIYGWSKAPYNAVWPGLMEMPLAIPATQTLQIGCSWIPLSPMWFFLMYFLPMETQLSGFVFYLIMNIVYPLVATSLGLMPTGVYASVWSHSAKRNEPPLYHGPMADIGAFMGMWAWPILLNWRLYAASFKRLLKPSSEAVQPVSGKVALLMLAIGFFGMYGMTVAGGGSPLIFLPWLIIWVCYMIAAMRLRAEVGWYLEMQYSAPSVFYLLFPGYTTNAMIDTNWAINNMLHHGFLTRLGVSSSIGPMYTALDSYKMAYDNRAHPKDIFKAHFIGRAIGIFVLFPLLFILSYGIGLYKTPGGATIWGSGADHSGTYWTPERVQTNISLYGQMPQAYMAVVAGFFIAGILTFLRTKFVWWPLNAVGFVLGTGTMTGQSGLGPTCGEVLLVKYICIKALGTRGHDRIVVPFIAGFAGGFALTLIAGMLNLALKTVGVL